jgi:hypothetical protein
MKPKTLSPILTAKGVPRLIKARRATTRARAYPTPFRPRRRKREASPRNTAPRKRAKRWGLGSSSTTAGGTRRRRFRATIRSQGVCWLAMRRKAT